MTIGKPVRLQGPQGHHAPAAGASGLGADGEPDGSSADTLGTPGIEHWQATYVSKDGLEQRGNVFFAAIEMTRMPMIITNPRRPDNPIVFANSAFVELTGYPQSALLGRNCRFLQGPDTDPGTVAEIGRAIRAQRAVAVDILNYKADGTPFWNGLYLGPVFDSDGRLLYYFASQLDITEKTRQLQSSLQSQKMEAIGALTAGLAHDFNNLLHVVSGNLELATRQLHGAEVAIEALARSRSALDKATRLTQQLLTFARKQHLQPRLESLNQIVLALTDMLAPTLTPAVSLRLDLAPGLPQCRVDADHLQTALLNLVKNAREALADGGTITVSTRLLRSDPGSAPAEEREQAAADTALRYVELAIRDDGPGMTDDIMRRATEPFFTTKGPGTGLGLAMVHGFAEQSQGKLLIASTVGNGTTITLRFPAVAADYADGAGARSGHDGAAAGADRRREEGD
ncbi:ATP-binding protein [Duganella sp. Leaf126]|uniref:ATP-binding protein n=1 Tax=Duganella sp. Leaf126 TaxID=1736266 RepID=UPI0009E7AFC2|nr:ATP-binding protein [Duganella sp. Leaf126]